MDQGVLKAIKTRYKKLIRRLIIEDDVGKSIVEFIKSVNMKTVVAELWNETQPLTLRFWRKIIAMDDPPKQTKSVCNGIPTVLANALQEVDEQDTMPSDPVFVSPASKGCALWHGVRIRIQSQEEGDVATAQDDLCNVFEFQCLFQELGLNIDPNELSEWLSSDWNDTGYETLTDTEICDLATGPQIDSEDDSDQEEQQCPVSHSEAAKMLEKCLTWLEHQEEASVYSTSVLRELHSLASENRFNSMKQTSITAFFSFSIFEFVYINLLHESQGTRFSTDTILVQCMCMC